MKIIDMHCDTLSYCEKGIPLLRNHRHVSIHKLREAQAMAQFFAIFIPTREYAGLNNIHQDPYQYYQKLYQIFLKEVEESGRYISHAKSYGDIRGNAQKNKISAILTVEDGVLLDEKMERLEQIYQDGVRLLTLTWFYPNCIGAPSGQKGGLTPFGRDVVTRMNELGMIVDVSHLSDDGFYDVASLSKKPFAASHSCARSLCANARNLTDEMLKTLADKGGVVGVNFHAPFLNGTTTTNIDDIVKHIRYMVDIAGIDVVAFGSDFDGINSTLAFEDYTGMPSIIQALQKCFTTKEVEKITHLNVMQLIKEVIG